MNLVEKLEVRTFKTGSELPKLKCLKSLVELALGFAAATSSAGPSLTKISPGFASAGETSCQYSFLNDVLFVAAYALNPQRIYI